MSKFDQIISGMKQMFPDSAISNIVTSKQIQKYITEHQLPWPKEFINLRFKRGHFHLTKPEFEQVLDTSEYAAVIPDVNKTYVEFGIAPDLDLIIKSGRFFPVYISGPSGNGKSTSVEQSCAKYRRTFIRVNINQHSDEESLVGSKTLIDGNVKIVHGPVIIAMLTGSILLVDECDLANSNSIMGALQSILEGGRYYFKLENKWITPKAGFNIFATANTKGKGSTEQWIGTNILNEAFLERFAVTLEQDYPPINVENKILQNVLQCYNIQDAEFVSNLTKWAAVVRKTYEVGGVTENITTRRLIHIVNAYSMYGDKIKAVTQALNRFDNSTKESLLDFYTKVSGTIINEKGN